MGNKLQKSVTDEIKFTESGLNLFSSPERRSLKCHKKQPGMTYPQCHTGLFLNLRPFHTKKTDRHFFLMFSAYQNEYHYSNYNIEAGLPQERAWNEIRRLPDRQPAGAMLPKGD